jgi:ribosomal protein S18 acetylase RimI-like enzyme
MAGHKITCATEETIGQLEACLPTAMPGTHRQRFRFQQESKGIYLLAWQQSTPVGHILLHFQHPLHHASCQYYPDCAYIEALATHAGHRRQGIARSLIETAEAYARQHGARSIGLSVGETNTPAQALYKTFDYDPTNMSPYRISWNYLDRITGELKEEGELCNFWLKHLH